LADVWPCEYSTEKRKKLFAPSDCSEWLAALCQVPDGLHPSRNEAFIVTLWTMPVYGEIAPLVDECDYLTIARSPPRPSATPYAGHADVIRFVGGNSLNDAPEVVHKKFSRSREIANSAIFIQEVP
jgi:hypothetical protein